MSTISNSNVPLTCTGPLTAIFNVISPSLKKMALLRALRSFSVLFDRNCSLRAPVRSPYLHYFVPGRLIFLY